MALDVRAAPEFKAASTPSVTADVSLITDACIVLCVGGGSEQVIVLGWTTEKIRWFLKKAGGSPFNLGLSARNCSIASF